MKVEVLSDQAYGSHERQSMDIALPADRKEEKPLIIFIHGGGWYQGDKSLFSVVIKDFAEVGYYSATINYRYADLEAGIHHPAQMEDIRKAIQHLVQVSASYGNVSQNVVLVGHSAGGHLSMLYGYDFDDNNQVTGVASMAGPVDLTSGNFQNIPELYILPYTYLGAHLADNPALWIGTSPYYIVNQNAPATMLIHAKGDELIFLISKLI